MTEARRARGLRRPRGSARTVTDLLRVRHGGRSRSEGEFLQKFKNVSPKKSQKMLESKKKSQNVQNNFTRVQKVQKSKFESVPTSLRMTRIAHRKSYPVIISPDSREKLTQK